MSTPTTVQGKTIPLAISLDDITYKNLVCSTAHGLSIDVPVNTEQSDCASHSSVGNPAGTATFSGLLNITPNGATEAGHDEVAQYANNGTKVYIKCQPGAKLFKGYGWITNFNSTKATESLYAYDITFTADGTWTIS